MKVVAGELDVNQIWGDHSWIDSMAGSEARLEARDGSTVNVVNGQGMRVFTETSDAGDRTLFQAGIHGDQQIASYDATGRVMYQIDEEGGASFQEVSSEGDLTVAGKPLLGDLVTHTNPNQSESILDWMPRGIVRWGERDLGSMSWQYREYGYLEVAAELYVGRLYKISLPPFGHYATNGSSNTLRLRYTSNGSVPNNNSTQLAFFGSSVGATNEIVQLGGETFFSPTINGLHRFLATITNSDRVRMPGSGFAMSRMFIEDVGANIPASGINRSVFTIPVESGGSPSQDTPPARRTYTTTWQANWFQSYRNNGATQLNSGAGANFPIQGYTPYFSAGGRQTSLFGFTGNSIAGETGRTILNALNGATVESVYLEIRAEHFHASTGGQFRIHQSNASSAPSSYADTPANHIVTTAFRRGQTRRLGLSPSTYGPRLASGALRAFGLAPRGSTSSLYYGYVSWAQRPRLIITYTR